MANEKKIFVLTQPHGEGDVSFCWQTGSGGLLATTGLDNAVSIYNRRGTVIDKIRLPGICVSFSWDADGDNLGIITTNSANIVIWDSNTQRKSAIDTGLRDSLSCLFWSKTSQIVAVATTRGNLCIYNHATAKRIPVLGKHNKKVTCGAWSRDTLLALGSDDKTVTINNNEGDTLRIITLRAEPAQITFSDMKLDDRTVGDNTVSILVGKRTLFLYNLDDPENPVELVFQQTYGSVVTYKWFGDGYILLGFSAGFFIAISTHMKEVGQELFQVVNHRDGLNDIALSKQLQLVASCGDNMVKIHDMNNLQETANIITIEEVSSIDKISWSGDGQLLAVGTSDGSIHMYLSTLSIIYDVHHFKVALLSSITQITVYQFSDERGKPVQTVIETTVEPEFIGVGPYHIVTGINNRAWFYDLTQTTPGTSSPLLIKDKEYLSNIVSIKMNSDYVSVLYAAGNLQLHIIEGGNDENEERENKLFPEQNVSDQVKITSQLLTADFLIFATDMGHIRFFSLEDWRFATEFRHDCGVKRIFSDTCGTRLVLLDEKSNAYLYNPVLDECLLISEAPTPVVGVVWDLSDRNTFVVYDTQNIITFFYNKDSVKGTGIVKVGSTKLPSKQVPLMLHNGELQLEATNGKLTQFMLTTHMSVPSSTLNSSTRDLVRGFRKHLALQRYREAWGMCELLKQDEHWKYLAETALTNLEIEWALRVYQQMKDVGMVWSLESIMNIEDKNLLAGNICMYIGEFDKAEEWYLKSNEPISALNLRRDLLQWDRALQLAKKLASHQVPIISREYAAQLEFIGNYTEALNHFEKGLLEFSSQDSSKPLLNEKEVTHHNSLCMGGIARNSIRVGDLKRGFDIASENSSTKQLKIECAEILENRKSLNEAASLYEKAETWDKAAAMYIRLKNWGKVGHLFPYITSHKIHLQYAKAKEVDGKYEEAVKAYKIAKDYDNVIRIYLDHLNNPQEAVAIVQETNSIEGAKLVADYFQKTNDFSSAIKFLVKSECFDEAFQLARRHHQMEMYGEILQEYDRPGDFKSLAVHFEGERNSLLAGKYYYRAKEYNKALRHLMRVAKNNEEENEAIPLAIELVGDANDESLTHQLVSFLLGETDGVPKDARFLFKLYMARKLYKDAAKTAVIIATEEQINGNYRVAHDLLLAMYQELHKNLIKIPQEMYSNLMLLHSYILVRIHVRRDDHLKGARLLIRVAKNISKFPSHIVPILTSTVIECSRAGLKTSAFNYAAMLMRPEYRSQIDPKYSKKIEAVVRKPGRNAKIEEEEPSTQCPVCESELIETELNCPECKSSIPFCIATGQHIVKDDLTVCPHCDFPAIMSQLSELVKSEETCPMCNQPVSSDQLIKVFDAQPYIHLNSED